MNARSERGELKCAIQDETVVGHVQCDPLKAERRHVDFCDVLVVEDEDDIAELLVEVLCEEGLPSRSAPNGMEALHLLQGGLVPRLIIVDLRMPVMTGWELLTELRACKLYQYLPIIVLSGEIDARARDLAQAAFFKPPEVDVLLKAVKRLLDQRHDEVRDEASQ